LAALAESMKTAQQKVQTASELLNSFIIEAREPTAEKYETVIVNRKFVWKSAIRATRGNFQFTWMPKIRFAGEEGEDYGGPRR
jgi:hypothetical protein